MAMDVERPKVILSPGGRTVAKPTVKARADALAAFHEISARIVASLDLDETLLAIARSATKVIDADIGAIFLPDEGHGLVARGVHGSRLRGWRGLRLNP